VGQPSRDLLPFDELGRAARHRFDSLTSGDERRFLQYGPSQGDQAFLERLATFLEQEYGHDVDPRTLFVTNGVSQGLDLVCSVLSSPGQKVLVEEPTYFLAGQILRDHGLEIVSVPLDGEGVDLQQMSQLSERHRPALFYTVSTHSNPSGTTLSGELRAQLVDLAEQFDFRIIADEVYQFLSFAGSAPPPPEMFSFDRGRARVIALQTFSKILCPGMRLGWLQARPDVVRRLQGRGYVTSGGGLNPVGAALAQSCLELDLLRPFVAKLRAEYGCRCRALLTAVRKHLPEVEIQVEPQGGYFVWLRFPDEVRVDHLLEHCGDFAVSLMPGSRFSFSGPERRFGHHARLSFAYYDAPRLEEGVQRLARCLRQLPL
jgi:DNA-binding transcriptional MocR family regulator